MVDLGGRHFLAAELIAEHQSQAQLEVIAMARYLAMILLVALFVTRMAKEIERATSQWVAMRRQSRPSPN